ncbi:fimbrin-like potential actin filament bundling protein [Phaffia rhodozyma]|uniref:Fimbrin n=1 Tax=Phaffia rhodozyma TaxID=264483 RepID=A0A0F7SJ54_PHARH|nr:fimbrin-like potential actin filament bundling protein [Phaffia rhodozyma]
MATGLQKMKLGRKYPQVSPADMDNIINQFAKIDVDEKGSLDKAKVIAGLEESGEGSYDQIRETLKTVNIDSSGRVELEDWVALVTSLRDSSSQAPLLSTKGGKISVKGTAGSNASHTMNEDERASFTAHINGVLSGDKDIGHLLPIPEHTMQIFDEARDGLILCKLINDSVPDTIDERVLNKPTVSKGKPKALNAFQITENNNIVISSAKGIGCSVVNIGPSDIADGTEHLILGLMWQIIRRGLLSKIDIKYHPELYRLLDDGETLEEFLRLPPDQILLRWFNFHLKAAGWQRRVTNFSKDVNDGENYTVLLNQLKPEQCTRAPLQTKDVHQRAEEVLQNADRIGCRKYLSPSSLVAGNPKLNLAFVANLFNTWPCLEPLDEAEAPPPVEDFDAEGEREARVFTLWLNSLDVEPGVYNLFEDLKDGSVILQAFDKVVPGSVIWRRVTKPKEGQEISRFKAVENTNYAVDLAQANGMRIVGIQGADIVDGTRTLVLGLVWQLMRLNIDKTLASISRNGKGVTDTEIVKWANDTVQKAGKRTSMRSLRDPTLRTGHFFLDLVDSLRPGIVDQTLVEQGNNEDECKLNARLAISVLRKLGGVVFVVAEDLVEDKPKLRLTFVAAIMAHSMQV